MKKMTKRCELCERPILCKGLCKKHYQQSWAKQNPEKVKFNKDSWVRTNIDSKVDNDLKREYGITLIQYNQMFVEQNGCCKLCNKPETAVEPRTGKIKRLAVDHDHLTGKVRRLLCQKHNLALGGFEDSIELLLNSIKYLEENK